jgi:hypothetical protein
MNPSHHWRAYWFPVFLGVFICADCCSQAAVRILQIQGVVRHNIGLAQPEALTKDTILMPGSALTTGKNAFVDLQFLQSGTLLRVAAETTLRLQADTFDIAAGAPSCVIRVELNSGGVVAIPVFAGGNSRLEITAQQGSCVASATGTAFEFSAAAKLRCVAGRVARGFVMGEGRPRDRFRIYPADSESGEIEAIAANDLAGLQDEINSLQRNSLIAL